MTMTSDARVASVPQAARKEWAREHLKGVESTVRVSFAPNLIDFDEEGIRHDVREHIRSGFNSMLCTQPGLTAEEKMRFMEIAADEAQGRILLSATADDDDLDVSKAILAKAESLGFSHSILRVPSVLGESEDGHAVRRGVGPDALEHAGAVVHGVGQDVHGGIGPVDELAVHPNFVGGGDGH